MNCPHLPQPHTLHCALPALALAGATFLQAAPIRDVPFQQDVAVRIQSRAELDGATFRRLALHRDGIVYVLTDRGVARVYETGLALDHSFRPLAALRPVDLATQQGNVLYLYRDRLLSNDDTAKLFQRVPEGMFTSLVMADNGTVLLAGTNALGWVARGELKSLPLPPGSSGGRVFAHGPDFFLLRTDGNGVDRITTNTMTPFVPGSGLTTLGFRSNDMIVGTHEGYFAVDARTGRRTLELQTKLPVPDITAIATSAEGVWFGTTRGVLFRRLAPATGPALPDGPGGIRYYAGQRWLKDDAVVDLALDAAGHLWVLTKTGLSKIEFRAMTLAEKADYFDRKIRSRHIRFGFSAERRLLQPGDVASGEMIDTDNDGGWSSYYLGSQAFRYAVTGDEAARRHAWETFAALERLQSLNPLAGFPARTFERRGFKFSDPDRWQPSPQDDWDWKATTSSDEISSHTFAYATMWECVVKTDAERKRVADCVDRILSHIVRNNLYLIDHDGKPTLWGRWNPEYVNWYPHTIHDRRLNSAEITASLQLVHRMTGKDAFRAKAFELFEKHGYLDNISSSMTLLKDTPGFVHQGNNMGDEWNHSDDELAFFTYWVLCRFAFNDELKARFQAAVRDHWEIERVEKFPIWNFIYAGCGGEEQCDPEGAAWTLRGYPMETITWRVENSHRKDLTMLPPNFRKQEMAELLPPGEHLIARCNTQPFILDAGDGGQIEFSGDEYLLGYWLGRYLKLIE